MSESTIYYEPPIAQRDPGVDIPWAIIIPLVLFIAVILYLISLTPAPKPVEKTLREEVNGVFDQINQEAALYHRDQVVGPLTKAQKKITEIFDKRKL